MRTRALPSILFLGAVAVAASSCDSTTATAAVEDAHPPVASARSGPPLVAKPFGAVFHTDLAGFAPGPECAADQLVNRQIGAGTSTLLGRFTVDLTFCVNLSDLGVLADGQLTEGESLPYHDGAGALVAANGDELHIAISGEILPSEDPDYDFQFMDSFSFTGGTGRFAGAGGEGMTDSLVDFAGGRTDHHWSGLVVVMPGR